MLTAVTIKNFRCLRDVTLQLEPLTILVGPNAAGKSTLLQGLNPDVHPGGALDFWRATPGTCDRVFDFDDRSQMQRQSVLHKGSTGVQHNFPGHIFGVQHLQLDPRVLRSENVLANQERLATDGSNLANVFATLTRRQQEDVVEQFVRLVPVYRDVNGRPTRNANGTLRLTFQDRWHDTWYEPSHVSDGSLIILALLTLGYQTPRVDVLTIEELERGLHPYLMGEIISMLRKMTRGELGAKPTQVVIATHSAELLEFADPKEVRFLSRDADGGVKLEAAPVSTPDWAQVVKDHQGSLGNLWLSGGLGGVPGGLGQ